MRRHLAGIVAGLLAVSLGACGGGSALKVEATAQFLAAAAQRTTDARTGRMEMQIDGTIEGHHVTFGATGEFDNATHRVQMRMDLSSLVNQLGVDPSSPQLGGLGDSMEMRFVDGVMYMQFPLLAKLFDRGTDWVSFKMDAFGSNEDFGAGPGSDPAAFLDYLRGAGADVQDLGHEDVRGVDTTHFATSIVPRHAMDAVPEDLRDRLQEQLDRLGARGDAFLDATIPVDVFVDNDGLVRRMEMEISAPLTDHVVDTTVRIDFFDFGVPVDIQAPPADQVTDITDKMSELGGGFAN